jgi:iron complex transport system substrate-binding protein
MAINGSWADSAIALGQLEGFLPYGGYAPFYYYEELGVSMPDSYVNPHIQIDKEVFYEKDPDVILTDPKLFEVVTDSWDESDTEEITENVAPFFGSTVFRKFPFHTYRFYDLYEAFEKLAAVFKQQARYEAFRSVHDDLLTTIEERRPTDEASIGLLNSGSSPAKGNFFAMDPTTPGSEKKQYRDLGVGNALPEEFVAADQIDYEQLLEADPAVIVFHSAVALTDDDGEFSGQQFAENFVRPMEEDSIGSQLTAVKEGRVYPGGHYQQGPIAHLFQTELAARQLYPDEFGAFDPERFPSAPGSEQLFDRQRVADIIDGDI